MLSKYLYIINIIVFQCLIQYISFEIMAGAYEISCPDPACEKDGVFQLQEIEQLVPKDLVEKHKAFRLNTEVALDSNRTWCPKPGCNTICHICASSTTLSNTVSLPAIEKSSNSSIILEFLIRTSKNPGITRNS